MNDITPKEANEILSHYTDLGYGIVIEGEDTSKIKQALSLANKTLANATPYNPTGDCISREDLRKEVTEKVNFTTVDGHIAYDKMLKLIDNAPTVEPRIEYGTDGQPYKLSMTNGKEHERPQGEWMPKRLWDNTHIWVCSECGNQNKHGITVEKACWKCGAKMKGGAE